MPKVSVLMPCLNMVKYIRECIDSVINQTLSDIEILVIDAGSTDGTINILQEYERRDSRVKLIHSDVKSYGYQMNLGIKLAQGEYVGIVETDDTIEPDMFESLYNIARKEKVDYVKGLAEAVYLGKNNVKYKFFVTPFMYIDEVMEKTIPAKDFPELFIKDNFLWNGIYESEFIKSIIFNETFGAAFQDIGALFQIISKASRAFYTNKVVYYYRQENMSASSYNPRGFKFLIHEYDSILPYLAKCSKEWKLNYYRKMFFHCEDRMRTMAASGRRWDACVEDINYICGQLKDALHRDDINTSIFRTNEWERFEQFLQNPMSIYDMWENEFKKKCEQIKTIVSTVNDSKVVIFGCKNIGQFIHMQLLNRDVKNVVAYCDNQKDVQGSTVRDLLVMSPEDAVRNYPKAKFVLTSIRYIEEMKMQLVQLGVLEEDIYIYNAGIDTRLFVVENI